LFSLLTKSVLFAGQPIRIGRMRVASKGGLEVTAMPAEGIQATADNVRIAAKSYLDGDTATGRTAGTARDGRSG
jgi:hypothetical protein